MKRGIVERVPAFAKRVARPRHGSAIG